MKGIEAKPINVGANLLTPASWSTFGSSFFFPNATDFFGLVFFGFILVILRSVDELVGKSHKESNDVTWDDDGCQALPNEAIEAGGEDSWRKLAALSHVLVKTFTYAVGDAVRICEEVTRSDKLWSLELKGLADLVGVSKQSHWGLSIQIGGRISDALELSESFEWIVFSGLSDERWSGLYDQIFSLDVFHQMVNYSWGQSLRHTSFTHRWGI